MHRKQVKGIVLRVLLAIAAALLIWLVARAQIVSAVSRLTAGVAVVPGESVFHDAEAEDGILTYRCALTLRNYTNQERSVVLKGIVPFECAIGHVQSPVMRVLAEDGAETVFTLGPGETEKFAVRFSGERGSAETLKWDRSLFAILCLQK